MLNKEELEFLKQKYILDFLYLVRNKNGQLMLMRKEPKKDKKTGSWYNYFSFDHYKFNNDILLIDSTMFKFVTWEEDKPFLVKELILDNLKSLNYSKLNLFLIENKLGSAWISGNEICINNNEDRFACTIHVINEEICIKVAMHYMDVERIIYVYNLSNILNEHKEELFNTKEEAKAWREWVEKHG